MKFCSECGCPTLIQHELHHKKCITCGTEHWVNPAPASMAIIETDAGVLLIERGINPGKGLFALPGGFVDQGETPPEAAARESFEEVGLDLDPSLMETFDYKTSMSGKHVLMFFKYLIVLSNPKIQTTLEAPSYMFVTQQNFNTVNFSFNHHKEVVTRYLYGDDNGKR